MEVLDGGYRFSWSSTSRPMETSAWPCRSHCWTTPTRW